MGASSPRAWGRQRLASVEGSVVAALAAAGQTGSAGTGSTR